MSSARFKSSSISNIFTSMIIRIYFIIVLLIGSIQQIQSQEQTVGIFLNDRLAINGYTLFSPTSSQTTHLIDNCGREINRWQFNTTPGMMAYLREDGSLVRAGRIFEGFGAGGSGGLIEIKSWDDELLWSYRYSDNRFKQHHDFECLENGNILLIAWEKHTVPELIEAGRIPESIGNNGVWLEQIVELKPIGLDSAEIIWEWHLYDHLVQDRFPERNNFGSVSENPQRLDINYEAFLDVNSGLPGNADWVHYNSIDYNPDLDLIVVSSRNMSEIYVIDHSTTTEEAAGTTGGNFGRGGDFLFRWGNPVVYDTSLVDERVLYAQHDARWLSKDGSYTVELSIFNNGLGRDSANTSSIEIISPGIEDGQFVFDETIQQFKLDEHLTIFPTEDYPFSSPRISGAQVFENGNILICSGNNGAVYEITNEGQLVWQYINPVSQLGSTPQGIDPILNDIFRALRYTPDFQAFESRELTPGDYLERDPLEDYGCTIYGETSTANLTYHDLGHRIYPNPFHHFLRVELSGDAMHRLSVFDLNGNRVYTREVLRKADIDLSGLEAGIYIVRLKSEQSAVSFKVLKI
jgi:hypothetical protein